MAYPRDFTVTEVTSASTNPQAQVEYPVHEVNDVLLLMMAQDGANTPALPSGYTNIANATGSAQGFRLCYKVAASSSEVCPTLSGTSDEWHIGVFSIGGVDTADPINVTATRTATDNATPFTWTSGASTDETNVLIFQFMNSDSGLGALCDTPGYTNLVNGDASSAGFACAVGFKPTAGAITNATWRGAVNDDTTACLVGFNDDGNGTRPGYCDPLTSATFLKHVAGTSLVESDTNPASLSYGAIGMRNFTQVWMDNAGAFTNETTDLASVGTADVTITNTVGNAWYFGYDYAFSNMVLQASTAAAGGAIAWEYWNGTAWTALVGQAGVLTAVGWSRHTHTPQANWAATSVNGVSKFYIRMRITTVFTTAPILSRGHAGGWLTTYDAIGSAADAGTNPYVNATSLTPPATSNFAGSENQFGSALNMSSGVMILHHKSALPRDYAVDVAVTDVTYPVTTIGKAGKSGSIQNYGGYLIVLGDSSSNYEAYSIHGKKSVTADSAGYNVAAIGLNNGAMPYGQIGSLNKSAITRMLMLPQGVFGAMLCHVSSLSIWNNLVFAGGDSVNPLDVNDLRRIANNSIAISRIFNGVGDFNRVYVPIQFGGGHPIKTLVNGAIFQFPTKYDGKKYFDFNGNDNVLGVEFHGTGAADELKFPNCTWKGGQPFYWRFDASHSASAPLDFTGNTVEGATVTLRSTVTLEGIKFIGCPTFTQNGATLSKMSFTNTKVDSATPADAAKISASTFTKTTGTQHAIEISGTAATMTLNAVDFVGYAGSNGSTGNEAIYVNIASGSMTINITGGGSTPSIRTAGATVTVQNAVTLTVTVLDAATGSPVENARVLVEKVSDGTDVLTGLTNASGIVTTSYAFTGDAAVVGTVRRATVAYGTRYKPGSIASTITSSGMSVTILLISDE